MRGVFFLFLSALPMVSCSESSDPSADAAAKTDLPSVTDAPAGDLAADLAAADLPSHESGPADQFTAADASPPDSLPAACNNFGAFQCSTTDVYMLCHGKCTSAGVMYTIYCSEKANECYCITGTTPGNTCPLSGVGCHACQNAFDSCCTF